MDVKQTPGSSDPEMETDDRGPDFARGQRELAKDPTAHPDFARGQDRETPRVSPEDVEG